MKKLILFLLILCFGLSLKAETSLVVWKKDGSKVAFALSDNPWIVFQRDALMKIVCSSKSTYFNYEDLAKLTYEEIGDSSIRNLANDKASSFTFDGETLLLQSLKAGSTISIHALNGTVVFKRSIEAAGNYSFPLTHLDKGVYLVSIDGLTIKIVKR